MAERKKPFDLGNALADVLGSVPGSDTGREQISYLDINLIDPDKENFYSMDGLDELAANIELVGLQQPLRVRENPNMPGRYLIVSGHRRRAALWTLYEEAPEKWGSVPCIIEPAAEDEDMQKLRLIFANSGTRQLTSADTARQVQETQTILYNLAEKGYRFKGRMRDHVAEACRISKTRVATLKVITDKLIPELRQLWEAGELNETCAYRLAQAPQEQQIRLTEIFSEAELRNRPEWAYDNWIQALTGVSLIHCPDDGAECSNIPAREVQATRYGDPCSRRCCIDCWQLISCKVCCEKAKEKKEQQAAEKKAQDAQLAEIRARAREEDEKRRREAIEAGRAAWARIGKAAAAAKASPTDVAALIIECEPDEVEESDIAELERRYNGCPEKDDNVFDNDPFDFSQSPEFVVALADLLHCSTDYLLGRAPDPAPAASEHVPAWKLLKCEGAWKRTITAADAAGVDIKELLVALFYGGNAEDVRDEDAQAVRDFADGGDAANVTDLPWEFPEELIYVADLLHCSTDYLLGRASLPTPASAASAAEPLQFRSGHPDHDAVCWCIFNYGNGESGCSGAIWKNECWNFYTIGATIDAECLGWIELPDYEEVLRE